MANEHLASSTAEAEGRWPLILANLDSSRIEIDPNRLVNLDDLPWKTIRRTLRWGKKTFVTDDRSDVQSLRIDATQAQIRELLGNCYFEPNWEFSTYYAGEVLNLRRVRYADHDRLAWWQVHVRGFQEGNSLELDPHWEPEPSQHPNAHLTEDYINIERGIKALERILDEENIEYEHLDPDIGQNEGNSETPS